MHAVRIGEGVIVTAPGETFTEIGMAVKERAPGRPTLFCGYTNGAIGYFPTPDAYPEGGYEPAYSNRSYGAPAPVVPESAAQIVEAGVRLAESLFPEREPWHGRRLDGDGPRARAAAGAGRAAAARRVRATGDPAAAGLSPVRSSPAAGARRPRSCRRGRPSRRAVRGGRDPRSRGRRPAPAAPRRRRRSPRHAASCSAVLPRTVVHVEAELGQQPHRRQPSVLRGARDRGAARAERGREHAGLRGEQRRRRRPGRRAWRPRRAARRRRAAAAWRPPRSARPPPRRCPSPGRAPARCARR